MKYLAAILILISSAAFADASLVEGSISGATTMFNQNENTGVQLGQAKATILQTAQTWQSDKNVYENTNAALKTEIASLQADVQHHESWASAFIPEVNRYNETCSGKQGNQDFVNQCNNWRSQLAPIKERFDADAIRLNEWGAQLKVKVAADQQNHDNLQARWAGIVREVRANEVAGQAYLARRKQIIDEITQLVNNFNTQCQTAVDSGNKELASETCGQAFDGNAIHQIHIPDFPSPQWTSWGASGN